MADSPTWKFWVQIGFTVIASALASAVTIIVLVGGWARNVEMMVNRHEDEISYMRYVPDSIRAHEKRITTLEFQMHYHDGR